MTVRVKDLFAARASDSFVGRTEELKTLTNMLGGVPRVMFVYGIAGIGKSACTLHWVTWLRIRRLLSGWASRPSVGGTSIWRARLINQPYSTSVLSLLTDGSPGSQRMNWESKTKKTGLTWRLTK